MKFLISLLFFAITNAIFCQVTIKGISRHPATKFEIGTIGDYLSFEKQVFAETVSDSMGRFQFDIDLDQVDKFFIKTNNLIGYLYAQPKSTYYIEFTENKYSNFQTENEIELVFVKLDTNDINYKILSFENWLDQSLNILYPLKEKNSGEFVKEIKNFRSAVNEIYKDEKSSYFNDYIKYSLGVQIEEIQDFASPSDVDKFIFYLYDTPVKWRNEKYFEFVKIFYDKYFYNQTLEERQEFIHLIDVGNVTSLLQELEKDTLIDNKELAEIVCLNTVSDLYLERIISKSNLLFFLDKFILNSKNKTAILAAQSIYSKYNYLDAGDKIPNYKLDQIKIIELSNKPIYIQFFNPSNKKCIAELAAMKKLYKNYGNYINFVTIYESKKSFSNSEKTYIDQIQWNKTSVEKDHPIWKDLGVIEFPYYVYILPNLIIGDVNALSPSPNGKYETIEKTLFEYKRLIDEYRD